MLLLTCKFIEVVADVKGLVVVAGVLIVDEAHMTLKRPEKGKHVRYIIMHVVIYSKAEGKQYEALFRYCCHMQCTVTWQTKSETVKKPASCAASSLKCYWLNPKSIFTWNRCVLQLMFLCWGRDCFWWSAWDSRKKKDYVTIRRTGGTCWSNCTPVIYTWMTGTRASEQRLCNIHGNLHECTEKLQIFDLCL